jgi:hypothetical protein
MMLFLLCMQAKCSEANGDASRLHYQEVIGDLLNEVNTVEDIGDTTLAGHVLYSDHSSLKEFADDFDDADSDYVSIDDDRNIVHSSMYEQSSQTCMGISSLRKVEISRVSEDEDGKIISNRNVVVVSKRSAWLRCKATFASDKERITMRSKRISELDKEELPLKYQVELSCNVMMIRDAYFGEASEGVRPKGNQLARNTAETISNRLKLIRKIPGVDLKETMETLDLISASLISRLVIMIILGALFDIECSTGRLGRSSTDNALGMSDTTVVVATDGLSMTTRRILWPRVGIGTEG